MRTPLDAHNYRVEAKLLDGASILIRAIRPDDKELLHEHFSALSSESSYLRFMGFRRDLSSHDLAELTELDFSDRVGLAATLTEGGRERFIGVGRYIRLPSQDRAEVAFAVLDDYQGRGIGSLLLDHLVIIARTNGIQEFDASVMAMNRKMLEVFEHSHYRVHETNVGGTVKVSILIQ